ncbi:2'-5' RNA ligase family protein [Bosea sp. (in: a-proteobacteria)]|jgi:2'-5' RNA ligase|uniref:2'-5' RNA ligase family protein n=1 Tax=Bosea sp. (in: a-proteobacteria) TaxID=1871050 RepID=UPI003F711DEC
MSRFGLPGQMSFDFGSPLGPSGPMMPSGQTQPLNFFFALMPHQAAAYGIRQITDRLRAEMHLPGSPRPIELFHVSLSGIEANERPLGALIAAARRAGDMVDSVSFPVSLDSVMSFVVRGQHVLVLACGEDLPKIAALHRKIDLSLKMAGLTPGRPAGATPHVTTLYGGEPVPRIGLDQPIRWTARDFVLVQSFVGKSHYVIQGRWPLRRAA